MEKEKFHWADEIAEEVIKQRGNKKEYTLAAGITPSGVVHIGNFREIITVDLVNKALKDLNKNVRFIYSWDDYDVFRKVPANALKKELLEKYLRCPITEVPDTYDNKHKSYAEHNEKEVEETMPLVEIHPQFIHQEKKYKNCDYAKQIKHVLENKDGIRKILDKYRAEERSVDWWPVSIFCDKCKKDTTKILNWNKDYCLTYECKCGHKEIFDFRKKGIVKLSWRIDWPMRWKYEGVDFEPAGKEHSTPGGSRTTAVEIFELLYKEKPPVYLKYDFITVKGSGGKMSSSLGNVISLKETLEIYEPDVIRYLFTSSRPNKEFAISFDLDVIKIYEDFDNLEKKYFGGKADQREKRIYELSCTEKPKQEPIKIPFRHLTMLLQIYPKDISRIKEVFEIKNDFDKKRLETRAKCAKNWLEKYAPEEFKFQVQEEVKYHPNEKEKEALKVLQEFLEKNKADEETLSKRLYDICHEVDIDPKDFFKIAYKIIINKEKGPKLATLIMEVGANKVVKLFKQLK